ncbi:hypothetical protein DERF_007353 [Dermatophagoides farinae]|uniref:Uncharacterized protein n=1 Tax=Dermatophagoides farinae TaxID=6954 RepID=A0A922I154_DERFA|nr:hypothetical protein DERF_007353 [Dermatophagoides farinae]
MDRMAELDVVLVMELASLGLAIFQMMDRMVALALELELSMFQMMDRMADGLGAGTVNVPNDGPDG